MAEYSKNGHRSRLRDRCLEAGFESFTERDKLELLLFYALPRIDTKPIAHDLLDRFKNIAGVLDASMEQLTEIRGIGENSAVLIKLIPEIIKEYTEHKNLNQPLDTTEAVCNYFRTKFSGETEENIRVACLDDKLRLIECRIIAKGVSNAVYLDIRNLVKFTYTCNSENIIIAHNHPNGDTIPSDEDIKMTADLFKKLKSIGINLLDHVIVAGGQAASLRSIGAFGLLK